MKYCLLLCGMFSYFMGFSQEIPVGQTSSELASNVEKTTDVVEENASGLVAETVLGTYYAKKFEGRKTSSGVRYRSKKMTAAHLTLPFGTIVTVTNLANGKSVDVEINDRGPHSKKFSIDVSAAAAKELGFFGKGVAKLEISYLPETE